MPSIWTRKVLSPNLTQFDGMRTDSTHSVGVSRWREACGAGQDRRREAAYLHTASGTLSAKAVTESNLGCSGCSVGASRMRARRRRRGCATATVIHPSRLEATLVRLFDDMHDLLHLTPAVVGGHRSYLVRLRSAICGSRTRHRPTVGIMITTFLDTWFSSALWPFLPPWLARQDARLESIIHSVSGDRLTFCSSGWPGLTDVRDPSSAATSHHSVLCPEARSAVHRRLCDGLNTGRVRPKRCKSNCNVIDPLDCAGSSTARTLCDSPRLAAPVPAAI